MQKGFAVLWWIVVVVILILVFGTFTYVRQEFLRKSEPTAGFNTKYHDFYDPNSIEVPASSSAN